MMFHLHIAFVGDDLNDLVSRNLVDLFITPPMPALQSAETPTCVPSWWRRCSPLAEHILKAVPRMSSVMVAGRTSMTNSLLSFQAPLYCCRHFLAGHCRDT